MLDLLHEHFLMLWRKRSFNYLWEERLAQNPENYMFNKYLLNECAREFIVGYVIL